VKRFYIVHNIIVQTPPFLLACVFVDGEQ